jgi:hypothetical protein
LASARTVPADNRAERRASVVCGPADLRARAARSSCPVGGPPQCALSERRADPRKIKRGAHRSVRELNADIRDWIDRWNENPKPYMWTKSAEQILETIAGYCTRITDSGH